MSPDSPALSEMVNEDQVNALNDIYQQNEFNLDSYLDKIQEKNEEEEKSLKFEEDDQNLQNKIKEKRQELKYISLDKQDNLENYGSKRSLKDHYLLINSSRKQENQGI